MVELDEGSFSQQLSYIGTLELPYTLVTSSGGKSLHFIICLEESLKDEAEWRTYCTAILKIAKLSDQANKNPSRYTRLAGIMRYDTNKLQQLVDVKERISKNQLLQWLQSHKQPLISPPAVALPLQAGMRKVLSLETRDFLLNGAPKGTINNRAFKAVANLLECGYGQDFITEKLVDLATRQQYNREELTKVVHSAKIRFEKHR